MSVTQNWDLSSYFPTFDGPEYRAHFEALEQGLDALETDASALRDLRVENAQAWATLYARDERLMAAFSHLASYIGCLTAAEVTNEGYRAAQARISSLGARFTKAFAPFLASLRVADDAAFAALTACEELRSARYYLGRLRDKAKRTMDPELEVLAAELGVDGLSAWSRLYDELAGRLEFEMPDLDDPSQPARRVPMAHRRSLLEDADPAVREAAFLQSNKAWDKLAHVAAAALNAISGARLTLYRRRGVTDFLEEPYFDAAVQGSTIEAMWSAVEENRETVWGYLRAKAKLLGKERLGFQDLYCPLPEVGGQGGQGYSWDQAVALVLGAFEAGYPALAEFSRQMFERRRVESEQRAGKRPGAFCTTSLQSRESRVFMNFGGTLGDAHTLAHELGHAFHGNALRELRPMAARYPMTLAETASTFAERLLQDAILANPATDAATRLRILTARCNDAATYLCDIHMRFLFEKALYAERGQGELGVSRLKTLMLDAQRESFGDALDPERLDPLFWASKLHFYISGVSFYNFPYTFGFLLSLSLAASLREQGPSFLTRYEDFLRLTGDATAEQAASRALGVELASPAFWRAGLALIASDVAEFQVLTAR
jgi:oligoendopeptidase F